MGETAAWKGVLDAATAREARVAIDAIVGALAARPAPTDRGDPFVALLFAEAARSLGVTALAARADEALDAAVSRLAERPMKPGLFGGFSGIAWLAMRLRRMRGEGAESGDDPCEEIDRVLIARLGRPFPGYDLISGLVGIGVYALERLSRPTGRELLGKVVDHLGRTATRRPAGITWHTPAELLPDHQRRLAPAGYDNLGLAHGVPGVVALLGHVLRAGVAEDQARRLLEGAVPWLLSEQLVEGEGARYPTWNAPGVQPIAARMAWCYGGLGLAAALMIAAREAGDRRWEAEAVRFALMEAGRASERAGVKDAGLCHGAAGNAHIFARFHAATGVAEFMAAARFWYGRALAMRTSPDGVGGYVFWGPLDGRSLTSPLGWIVESSFLSGSAGVALALVSAVAAVEPAWDRLLLCDIPLAHA